MAIDKPSFTSPAAKGRIVRVRFVESLDWAAKQTLGMQPDEPHAPFIVEETADGLVFTRKHDGQVFTVYRSAILWVEREPLVRPAAQ